MAVRWATGVELIGLPVQLLSQLSCSVNRCGRFVICGSNSIEEAMLDTSEALSFRKEVKAGYEAISSKSARVFLISQLLTRS